MNTHSLRRFLPFVLGCLAGAGLIFAVTEPVPVNAICPVTSKPVDSGKTVTYTKDLHFCCDVCQKSFEENADAKVKEIAAVTPETTKCLMCKETADKEVKTTYTRVVAVSDDKCIAEFAATPDKFIVAAVTHPRPVNDVCPMSGEKVDPKCTAAYEKEVLFCSQACHDTFDKEADKHVEKIAAFDKEKGLCVMCDHKADPAHHTVYRRTIGFHTPLHAEAFKTAPDANIAKAIQAPAATPEKTGKVE